MAVFVVIVSTPIGFFRLRMPEKKLILDEEIKKNFVPTLPLEI